MIKIVALTVCLLASVARAQECHSPSTVAENILQADPQAEVSLYAGDKAKTILNKLPVQGGVFDDVIVIGIGQRAGALILFKGGCATDSFLSGNPRGLAEEIKKVLGNDV